MLLALEIIVTECVCRLVFLTIITYICWSFFFCVWCMPANNYYVLPLYQNIRHYLTLTVSKNVYFDRGSSMYYLSLSLKSCVRHVRV